MIHVKCVDSIATHRCLPDEIFAVPSKMVIPAFLARIIERRFLAGLRIFGNLTRSLSKRT